MTATHASSDVRRLRREQAPALARALERDFASCDPGDAALMNQHLLDALDHGEHERFWVWPSTDPVAVVYRAPNGTLIPAGEPEGASALAAAVERAGWRVLIGDEPIGRALLACSPTPLLRRGPRVRVQRFMVLRHPWRANPPGLRPATLRDLETVTEFACRLHEEDLMGPPISRSGRAAVRVRMMEAMSRASVWVLERGGLPVGKVDLSLRSLRRGAQIAGVYVTGEWRGRGLAREAVAAIGARLLDEGLPGVTLHVRADNRSALAAYTAAGFEDAGSLVLALR